MLGRLGVVYERLFGYQHVGIGNAKVLRWGVYTNANAQREPILVLVGFKHFKII